jgi:hypothetical protein
MKRLSLLLLVVLSFSAYAVSPRSGESGWVMPQDEVLSSHKEITYTCKAYTSNRIVNDKTVTDNAPIMATTRVVQTLMGFTIRPGAVYAYKKELTNSNMGSAAGMAGDPTTLILKKDGGEGNPYFIIYEFEETKVQRPGAAVVPGAAKRLIVLGKCTDD